MRDIKEYISKAKSHMDEERDDLSISEAVNLKRTVIEIEKRRQDPLDWIYYSFLFGFECGYQAKKGEE